MRPKISPANIRYLLQNVHDFKCGFFRITETLTWHDSKLYFPLVTIDKCVNKTVEHWRMNTCNVSWMSCLQKDGSSTRSLQRNLTWQKQRSMECYHQVRLINDTTSKVHCKWQLFTLPNRIYSSNNHALASRFERQRDFHLIHEWRPVFVEFWCRIWMYCQFHKTYFLFL